MQTSTTYLYILSMAIFPLMHDVVLGNMRLIHLGDGEESSTWRPPHAMLPVHFLLRNKLSNTMRLCSPSCTESELPWFWIDIWLRTHNMNLVVLHVRNPIPTRRYLWIHHRV